MKRITKTSNSEYLHSLYCIMLFLAFFLLGEKSVTAENRVVLSELNQIPQKSVQGTVTDNHGKALFGAKVVVKGTTIATETNDDGSFQFSIPYDKQTLVFSYSGMKTQEGSAAGKSYVNIAMKKDEGTQSVKKGKETAFNTTVLEEGTQLLNQGKETVFKTIAGPNNPRNTEGDFITLKDGRILFIYTYFTTGSDFGDAYLVGRYSSDQGKTWSSEDVKVVEQEGKMNVMSVSLLRLQNGEIALFYLKKNSKSDCIPYMRISTDEAETWGEPIQCIKDKKGYFVVNNNRVIQLPNGRLLMPASLHKTEDTDFTSYGRIWCYYSDNNGATWKPSEDLLNPDSVILQEPGVIELKNGNIMMFMRASGGVQYLSYSKDNGKSWSPAEPSNIKSPISPASIARIPSTGDLLLVWNNNDEKAEGKRYFSGMRTPLTVAISKDEGKTWLNIKNIEDDPDGTFCYIAIHFTRDHVLLGYGVWAEYIDEYIARLSNDWIYE